jgi:toxin-antitoxin system PIN domain toxin
MIAVDTNLLVYAHRADSPWHAAAKEVVRSLAESRSAWAIPWPCMHEFLAVVTHPRIYRPPSTLDQALAQAEAWLGSPSLSLLAEAAWHMDQLGDVLRRGKVVGPQIHDARIAALCLEHGVSELWSADRDFARYPQVTVKNPLVAP